MPRAETLDTLERLDLGQAAEVLARDLDALQHFVVVIDSFDHRGDDESQDSSEDADRDEPYPLLFPRAGERGARGRRKRRERAGWCFGRGVDGQSAPKIPQLRPRSRAGN